MARPVESDTETHKYLIEVIRQTCNTKQLIDIINANGIAIPWTRIPTGSNRAVNDWQTELRHLGIHQELDSRTTSHQSTHAYSSQTQQASSSSSGYRTIAPAPPAALKLTSPTSTSGAPSSTPKKRGRPPKEKKEGDAAVSGVQKKSEQDTQARPIKRIRQNPPPLATGPPATSNTSSIMSATTNTTSPATATQSSTGPDSAPFSAFAGIPSTGLAISSAPAQPIVRPAEQHQHPRLPGPNTLPSPTANTQALRTLPVPRPTDYTQRDSSFVYPGIPSSSGPTNTFFGAPPPYSQSYARPPTPSYPQPFRSPLPHPQPQYRYEGPQPRSNEPRRPDDDTMEH